MKAALGCQLALLLQQSYGLEAQATEAHVDVLAGGFAFRLRLVTERDAAMQQKLLAERERARVGVGVFRVRAASGPRLKPAPASLTFPPSRAHPSRAGGLEWLPPSEDMAQRTWLQGAISGVAGENPAFAPTLRLAKRWVGAHLLSPHLAEEAVELLVAGAFTGAGAAWELQPVVCRWACQPAKPHWGTAPWDTQPQLTSPPSPSRGCCCTGSAAAGAPSSRLSGFLRFLHLVGGHPWAVQPLIVDPSGELKQLAREELQRAHSRRRGEGAAPPPALCICTPRDPAGAPGVRASTR